MGVLATQKQGNGVHSTLKSSVMSEYERIIAICNYTGYSSFACQADREVIVLCKKNKLLYVYVWPMLKIELATSLQSRFFPEDNQWEAH